MTDETLEEYVEKITPLLDLAKKAYGSRNTKSPQHDASRQYTDLLVEFYNKGGSLLKISKALGVTYAGIRRRVTTASVPTVSRRTRSKATEEQVLTASTKIQKIRESGTTEEYHEALRSAYEDEGISLAKIAKALGLSSANPLYYGVARTKIKSEL